MSDLMIPRVYIQKRKTVEVVENRAEKFALGVLRHGVRHVHKISHVYSYFMRRIFQNGRSEKATPSGTVSEIFRSKKKKNRTLER